MDLDTESLVPSSIGNNSPSVDSVFSVKASLSSMSQDCKSDSLPESPLNLSPKSPDLGQDLSNPKLQTLTPNFPTKISEGQNPASVPWSNWSRSSYFFPGVLPTFPMPPLCPLPCSVAGINSSPLPQDLTDPQKGLTNEEKVPQMKSEEDYSYKNIPILDRLCDEPSKSISEWNFKSLEKKEPTEPSHHYQIKWSNHSSRLTSFISSLQGDVSTSDTIITTKSGTTFYAHRLVLAAASPFFSRTLKNIPREQQAVVVIPRASSRLISAILSFCYTGKVGFPPEDLKAVLELAEDLEISGLLSEKVTENIQSRCQYSPSSVFRFTPPGAMFPLDVAGTSSRNSTPPYTPFLFPSLSPGPMSAPSAFKREVNSPVNYSQHTKRIKSDSDVTTLDTKKPVRNSHSGFHMKSEGGASLPQRPSSLTNYSKSFMIPRKVEKPQNSAHLKNIISRQILSAGSRVLLWRFLLELLHDPRYSPYYIRWLDRPKGVFRIMESDKVAQLWGSARKNDNMTYEKMSRGMRTYYKRGILFHLDGTKLIYRFNVLEPEIQHVMGYHEVMSQRMEDQTSSPYISEQTSPLPHLPVTPNSSVTPKELSSPYPGDRERHESNNIFFGEM